MGAIIRDASWPPNECEENMQHKKSRNVSAQKEKGEKGKAKDKKKATRKAIKGMEGKSLCPLVERFDDSICSEIEYDDYLKNLGYGFDMLLIFTQCSLPDQKVVDMNYGYFCFSDFPDFKDLVVSQVIIGFNDMYIRYADKYASEVNGGMASWGVEKEGAQQWRWGKVDFTFNGSKIVKAGFDKSIEIEDVEFYMYRNQKNYVVFYKKTNNHRGNYNIADMEQNKLYTIIRLRTKASNKNRVLYEGEMIEIKRRIKEFEPSKDDCSRTRLEYVYKSRSYQSFKTEGVQCPDIKQTLKYGPVKKPKKQAEAERAVRQDENRIATGTHR